MQFYDYLDERRCINGVLAARAFGLHPLEEQELLVFRRSILGLREVPFVKDM